MMNFIMLTLSITVAMLLYTIVLCVFMTQPWATKLYVKWINKYMQTLEKTLEEE